MTPERTRLYVLHGLSATPVVLETLLNGITEDEADYRPDPERFTIREALAHMADWEPIWRERIRLIAETDDPFLPGYDEGQWAIDNDYAHSVVAEQVAKFRAGREALTAYLRGLSPEAWERTGRHEEWKQMSIANLAALVLGHDGYHTRQIIEWRAAAKG
jgi:uncharacterized damage-inducible protein DinB